MKTNNEEYNSIYNYLKPTDNDKLSDMKGIDLQELLFYLEDYYLTLRNELKIDKNITFGLEIEVEKPVINNIKQSFEENDLDKKWTLKKDLSLAGGIEAISPKLIDTKHNWQELKKICDILEKYSIIGNRCGGHIHVGIQALGTKKQTWINFINLWSTYENIIYRFVYGEYLNARYAMNKYASPIALELKEDYKKIKRLEKKLDTKDIINMISKRRGQAVNFLNINLDEKNKQKEKYYNNTIEFRCPNGTINPVIWQNNTNLFINLLNYINSPIYDNDIIEKRKILNDNKYFHLYWYSEIYLQQSLELCDMLFNNNLDKIYFLKQYLKNFEINDRGNSKSKPFTKKR